MTDMDILVKEYIIHEGKEPDDWLERFESLNDHDQWIFFRKVREIIND